MPRLAELQLRSYEKVDRGSIGLAQEATGEPLARHKYKCLRRKTLVLMQRHRLARRDPELC